MNKIRVFALALFLGLLALLPLAAESDGWSPGFDLRLFGLDLKFTSDSKGLTPAGKLELFFEAGGGLEDRGYYRNLLGERVDSASPDGSFKIINSDFWLKATQYLDKASHLRASAWIRSQQMTNFPASSTAAPLLFLSGLPESPGFYENGAGLAFGYTDLDKKTSSDQTYGLKADLSYEWFFEFYPTALETANVHEFVGEFSWFLPLINTKDVSLVFGEHAIASALLGPEIPEHRRSYIGGNRYGSYKALGGLVRGVAGNYGDGRLKAGNNVELRFVLPGIFKKAVMPGINLFADVGIADDGNFGRDLESFQASTGAIVTIQTLGFTLYAGGSMNLVDNRGVEFYYGFGNHF